MNIAQQLSRYLRKHPDGCDTAEGIARWWIDADDAAAPVALIETALEWMVQCQLMEALPAADGRVRYRRASSAADLDAKLAAMTRDPHLVFPGDSMQHSKKAH
ncbi:MAG: hypothetical protein WCH35_06570 [Comamonadaceae bacterium]